MERHGGQLVRTTWTVPCPLRRDKAPYLLGCHFYAGNAVPRSLTAIYPWKRWERVRNSRRRGHQKGACDSWDDRPILWPKQPSPGRNSHFRWPSMFEGISTSAHFNQCLCYYITWFASYQGQHLPALCQKPIHSTSRKWVFPRSG